MTTLPAETAAADERSSDTPAIRLVDLSKTFGSVEAVAGVDLEIAEGEFFAMLGPSGSGKTTVLRMIAGFEQPTGGTILLGGNDVTRVPPFDRDVNTVFQDYALFPHMNVEQNVEYGLRVKHVARHERQERVAEALATVQLKDLGKRKPSQLSGGQRQRVALARALVNRPRVLLLDEPLGALDLKLREQMQVELKQIQRLVGITFVFVTHDQEEALTMADRVAVMHGGRIEQVGSPSEVYERPASPFVAGFVGTSNLITGEAAQQIVGRGGTYSVRPEKIRIVTDLSVEPGEGECSATGTVTEVVYTGPTTRFVVDLDVGRRSPARRRSPEGTPDAAGQAWARGETERAGAATIGTVRLVAMQQNLQRSSTDVLRYRHTQVRLVWDHKHNFEIANTS